jgi:hypothetical protein
MNNGMMGGMPNLGYDMGQPVLANNAPMNTTAQPGGALSGNARGSIRMPQIPQNQRINMGGEGLMRIGGNMIGASANGGLAALNAGTNTYGDIMDYNRARDMDEFAIQEAQALEQQRRLDLQRKMEQPAETDNEAVGMVRTGMAKMNRAKAILEENKNLTGLDVGSLWNRVVGKTAGNKEEAIRLFLTEIRLDSIMQRVSETKGAISNAEMALFGSQAPDMNAQESVWLDWITRQLEMSQILLNRLETGERVNENAALNDTMPTISPSQNTAPTNNDDQYIVEEVTPTN